MATWYYKGRTPTPVNIPGRGSVVLTRGAKFEAPASAIHHLIRTHQVAEVLERVRRAPSPVTPAPQVVPVPTPVQPEVVQEIVETSNPEPILVAAESVESVDDPGLDQDVVDSAAQVVEVRAEVGTEDGVAAVAPEQKQKQSKPRRKKSADS